ncbi:MAG: hypothetical protein ACYDCK_00400 [Thermoplasmatota archaeon]
MSDPAAFGAASGASQARAAKRGSAGQLSAYGAERRIQVVAIGALLVAIALAAASSGFTGGALLGLDVSPLVVIAALVLALVLGVVAIVARRMRVASLAVALAVVAVVPGAHGAVTLGALVLDGALALALLGFVELVGQAHRYERMRGIVESTHTSAAALDHAVAEYLKTFVKALGWTALGVAVIAGTFALVRVAGPAQLGASRDYGSVLGLTATAALFLALAALLALAKGADFTIPRPARSADPERLVVEDED